MTYYEVYAVAFAYYTSPYSDHVAAYYDLVGAAAYANR